MNVFHVPEVFHGVRVVRGDNTLEDRDLRIASSREGRLLCARTMRVKGRAHEVGTDFYPRIVKPEFLAAVRSVVSGYTMVTVPEHSTEIASKVQAVVVEKLKGKHSEIQSVALADVDFPQIVLNAIEHKQAKEQEKEQKEFELTIAAKDAEIARTRAKGEGDSIRIRAEGESEGLRIRALGQAKAQETIGKTLTPDYLRFKLYDSQNSKFVLLPDKLNVPILINPGTDTAMPLSQDALSHGEREVSSR